MLITQRRTTDLLYLLGGTRAATHKNNYLFLFPTATGGQLEFPTVTHPKTYYKAIRSIELDLIGYEQQFIDDRLEPSTWYMLDPEGRGDADNLWDGISHTSRREGHNETAELAKRIAFALRTSAFRLRDCAREYAWQNEYAVSRKVTVNRGFANMKTFDVSMALHSLLTDMGTARDYLANFISRSILRDAKPVDSMSKLYDQVEKVKGNISNIRVKQLMDTIIAACDRERPEGWMARLGEFRNIVVHRSPLVNLSGNWLLQAKTRQVEDNILYQIYFGVPHDPFDADSQPVDALEHFRAFLLNLLDFAYAVAAASGIKPTVPNMGPALATTTRTHGNMSP